MADNVIEENVIDKIQVKGETYYFGIKYDSERNVINDTYFRRNEMPQIEQVVTKAGTAVTGAENVNATITDANVLEVTDRTGTKKSLDMSDLVSAPVIAAPAFVTIYSIQGISSLLKQVLLIIFLSESYLMPK